MRIKLKPNENKRWGDDIIVAFDKAEVLNSTNSRDVLDDHGNVSETYLIGCRACQELRGNCVCPTPDFRELLVYDREVGLHGPLFRKYFRPELGSLIPGKSKMFT